MASGKGLYLPSGAFREFSELRADRAALAADLATRETAGESWLASLGLLPDPDPVLRKRGDDAQVLADLTADDQVCSAIQGRKIKTLNKRDFRFLPGKEDGKDATAGATALCRGLAADLERVDLFALFSEVLDAPYYGYTVAELSWRPAGGRMALADISAKPRRWFGFDRDNRPCFRQGDGNLVPIPLGKGVLARHHPTYDNPYGLRLLSRCLWPVAFKRGGVQFMMNFAEKFGLPWIVGHCSSPEEAKRRTMLGQLSSMVQDAVAVISGSDAVDIHDVSGKAGSLHQDIIRHWDAAIARVVMGQTLTSSDGDGKGSYALGQTHYAVLQDYADADEALVATFMTDLAWTYGQVNAPGELCPVFEFVQPEDHAAQAELDVKLKDTGVRFTKAHYTRTYGLAEDEFELAEPAGAGGKAGADFSAAGDPGGEDAQAAAQDALDRMVAAALPAGVRASEASVQEILAIVDRAESFEDMQVMLAEALSGLAGDADLERALAEIMAAADLYGRYGVREEGRGA